MDGGTWLEEEVEGLGLGGGGEGWEGCDFGEVGGRRHCVAPLWGAEEGRSVRWWGSWRLPGGKAKVSRRASGLVGGRRQSDVREKLKSYSGLKGEYPGIRRQLGRFRGGETSKRRKCWLRRE